MWIGENIVNQLYSQVSANGHSRKRTVLLTDTVFNSPFLPFFPFFSYGNNSRKRTALSNGQFFQFPRVSAYERVDCMSFNEINLF